MRPATASALRWPRPRAALGRLAEATPGVGRPARRRTSSSRRRRLGRRAARPSPSPSSTSSGARGDGQFALDHARLLGPLGSIPDADERRAVIADLVDDLLAPLGTVVTPAGPATGPERRARSSSTPRRAATRARPASRAGSQLVDLPPGTSAVAEFRFRDTVRLGGRGRHFAIEVAGGLGGLLVDLRDVPLRLPDRGRPPARAARGVAGLASGRAGDRDDRRTGRSASCPSRRLIEAPGRRRVRARAGRPARSSRPATSVVVGAPIAERLRDPRLEEPTSRSDDVPLRASAGSRPRGPASRPAGRHAPAAASYLFDWQGRWRVATGDIVDPLESPVAGIVREVRPGIGDHDPGRGSRHPRHRRPRRPDPRPARARDRPDGELRPGGLDVGLAGTILVVGSRVDAETLTRARAMGVRGVVVAGLPSKERRDFLASEARQRAALHRLPPFAVLVLDGATAAAAGRRRSWRCSPRSPAARSRSSPTRRCSCSTAGPRRPDAAAPTSSASAAATLSGREGRWSGAAGPRRFAGGVHLEAGLVRLADGTVVAVPARRPRAVRLTARPMAGDRRFARRAMLAVPGSRRRRRALGRVARDRGARPGDLVCLWGDLGAGKTHLAKAFGAGLGVTDTIISPSFILMAEYAGRLPLFHLDLYRLATPPTRWRAASSTSARRPGSPSSSGPTGWATRSRPSGSTSCIDGSGDEPRSDQAGRRRRGLPALPRGAPR